MDDSSTTWAVVFIVLLIVAACLLFGIGGHPDGDPGDPYGMPARCSVLCVSNVTLTPQLLPSRL